MRLSFPSAHVQSHFAEDRLRHDHTRLRTPALTGSASIHKYYAKAWAARFGDMLMPTVANGITLDWNIALSVARCPDHEADRAHPGSWLRSVQLLRRARSISEMAARSGAQNVTGWLRPGKGTAHFSSVMVRLPVMLGCN
jgi:hypothetical protein